MIKKQFHLSIHIWVLIILLIPTITPYIPIRGFRPIMHGLNTLFFCYFWFSHRIGRGILNNKLIVVYALLVVYHCVNCYLQRVPMSSGNGYLAFFIPVISNFCVMATVYILFLDNPRKTLLTLCAGYVLYVVLAYQSVSEVEGRLIGEYIHPNQYAQAAGMGLFVMLITKNLRYCSLTSMCIMMIFPILAIFACGSRNGLGLLFIVMSTSVFAIALHRHTSLWNLLGVLVLLFFFAYAGRYILDNSFVGNRLLTHETSDKFYVHTGTIIDVLGDRAIYYVLGFRNFLTNPLFGIGLWNFNNFNNFGYPLHSEYMIHFCEGGIIGISLYAYFVCSLLYSLLRIFWEQKYNYHFVVLMAFVSYLFIGLTAREIYYTQFFPILGICLAYVKQNKNVYLKKPKLAYPIKKKYQGL